jgi:hypothetical protein
MPNYRFALVSSLFALGVFAASLISSASAQSQTPKPPKVTTYMVQVRSDFRNGAAFTAPPGYKIVSVVPCSGAGGPYGQGAYLCMIERKEH